MAELKLRDACRTLLVQASVFQALITGLHSVNQQPDLLHVGACLTTRTMLPYCSPLHASALTRAQISEIETTGIRRKYAGKQAPRPNRPKISTALRVINKLAVDRPREDDAAKEGEKRQREAAKAARGAMGAGRGQGARGRMGRRGGAAIGAENVCLQTRLFINYHLLAQCFSLSPLQFLTKN